MFTIIISSIVALCLAIQFSSTVEATENNGMGINLNPDETSTVTNEDGSNMKGQDEGSQWIPYTYLIEEISNQGDLSTDGNDMSSDDNKEDIPMETDQNPSKELLKIENKTMTSMDLTGSDSPDGRVPPSEAADPEPRESKNNYF